jgi:hypothetical protein
MVAMTFDQFHSSLANAEPDPTLPSLLKALWWDAKGDWNQAHEIAQADEQSREAAWVHAYLHRKEGDSWNAGYWYRKADQPAAKGTLEEEWRQMATTLLGRSKSS